MAGPRRGPLSSSSVQPPDQRRLDTATYCRSWTVGLEVTANGDSTLAVCTPPRVTTALIPLAASGSTWELAPAGADHVWVVPPTLAVHLAGRREEAHDLDLVDGRGAVVTQLHQDRLRGGRHRGVRLLAVGDHQRVPLHGRRRAALELEA